MNFDSFIGNEKIKQQLAYLVESGRLPHAIIFEGEEGLGKRTLAKELALNMFCNDSENKPCRSCTQCIKVIKDVHPDIYYYSAPDRVRAFSVKKVREIIEDVYVKPNEADYKIYVLGNCQSMSVEAQNAFLKILEEPPEYAVFILCLNNKSTMLETVLSRSVVFSLEAVDYTQGAEYICDNNDGILYEDALKAIEITGGNIGKAIITLNDGELSEYNRIAEDIALSLLSDYEYKMLEECTSLAKNRDKMVAVLSNMKNIFRDALLSGKTDNVSTAEETAKKLSSRLSKESLFRLVNASEELINLTQKNCNNNILITKITYDLRAAIGK